MERRGSRVALGVLAWLAVVTAVAVVAWLAIDRAGRQVLDPSGLPQARELAASGGPTGAAPGATAAPTGSPGATSPTGGPAPSTRPTTSAPPSTTAPVTRPPSTTGSAPAAPSPSAVQRSTRTVTVVGGRVAVSCQGSRVSLLYATPSDGWQVEVDHAGPDEVEVHFLQRAGGDGEDEVRALCAGGSPQVTGGSGYGGTDDGARGDAAPGSD